MNEAPATHGSHHHSTTPMSRRELGALVGILVLAAVIRLAQLNAQSLTMDEVKDLAMAHGSYAELEASQDRFPPLYHTLLHGWLKVVPWDTTGRGFSTLCGVLTVVAIAGLARALAGPAAGLCAAGLAALAPFDVWYSVEARAYGLYLLLGAVALWQFAVAIKDNRPAHWTGFAAACIAGAYTHYYFGLLIALTGLTFLGSRPKQKTLMRGLTTYAIIAAATAPSLWMLRGDLDQPWGYARTSAFTLPGLAYTYFSYLSGYTLGPSLRDLHTMPPREAVLSAAPWVALIGAATIVLLVLAFVAFPPEKRKRRLAWLGIFSLAPPAIIGLVSDFGGFGYNTRHVVWACAPLMAILAAGIANGKPRWLAGAAAGMLAVSFAFAHYNRLASNNHRNEDARAVASFVSTKDPEAPVFVLSGYMSVPLKAYLPAEATVVALPSADTGKDAAQRAVESIRQHTPEGRSFWLAYSRPFHGDPQGKLFAALDDAYELHGIVEFAGFHLYSGRVR